MHPMVDLGMVVAQAYPRIADWEKAISYFNNELNMRGVVQPDRFTVVKALLTGYLLVGKQNRAIGERP
jgi:hypothetical protein